ncbi:DnaD domain protein [Virgibacillus ndiopensis]|uniref:DnaD domain protein n=1 Tax=Virgibacillus ndiopensis TaxID=2004408 RepID=UPI00159B9326|nr:DnaD domain protein [Virgibacillus ndiopensis]
MNYIKEMNAFYNRIIFSPLSGSAIALWHTLMHFNNLSGWQKSFTIANKTIESISGVTGSSLTRARNELVEKGFILMEKRNGSLSPIYQMISQVQRFDQNGVATVGAVVDAVEGNTVDSASDSLLDNAAGNEDNNAASDVADNVVNNPADNADPLYKQYNTKQEGKQNSKQHKTDGKQEKAFSSATQFFQKNFGKANTFTAKEITSWVNNADEELVLHAMKRALELDRKSWGYVKWILNDWQKKELRTVEDVAIDDMLDRIEKRNKGYQHRREVVPDWFRESKQAASKRKNWQDKPMDSAATAAEKEEITEF